MDTLARTRSAADTVNIQCQDIDTVYLLYSDTWIQFTCYTPIHGYSLLVTLRYMDTVYSLYSDIWIQFTPYIQIHGYSLLIILRYIDIGYKIEQQELRSPTIQDLLVAGALVTDNTRTTSSRSSDDRQYKIGKWQEL